jgi:hypothetical protein
MPRQSAGTVAARSRGSRPPIGLPRAWRDRLLRAIARRLGAGGENGSIRAT